MEVQNQAKQLPQWFWIIATLGLLWNVFGVVQFIQSLLATRESLMTMGMTDVQAAIMKGYPLWMNVAFAVGTIGGCMGSVALLMRKKLAKPIFAVSLVGYLVLYTGDITEGVFAALGSSQVVILTSVVLIAAGLFWLSNIFKQRGSLT